VYVGHNAFHNAHLKFALLLLVVYYVHRRFTLGQYLKVDTELDVFIDLQQGPSAVEPSRVQEAKDGLADLTT
jgi:hypothetical protein